MLLDSLLGELSRAARDEAGPFDLDSAGSDLDIGANLETFVDLRHVGHPATLGRYDLLRQILLPAVRDGQIPDLDEADLEAEVNSMSLDDVRDWAGELLRAHPWPPGFEIPSFAEFVESPEYLGAHGVKLTAHQRWAIESSIGSDALAWFVEPRRITTLCLVWGKGCQAANTVVRDYATGVARTMLEWERLAQPLTVLSWDGEKTCLRPASAVYHKGRAQLFTVRTADGRSEQVTAQHRYQTPDGWKCLRDLRPGDQLLALSKCASGNPQFIQIESIEPNGEDDFYDLTVPGTECYFSETGILSHNSGKDLLSNWVCAYVAYVVITMRNPWFHFRMPMGEILDIINVAQDEDSARQVFYAKLKVSLQQPCFSGLLDKGSITADITRFYKPIPGDPIKKLCVRINSLHSRNEGAEGRNTFFWIMDEADALRDSKGHGNARRMYNTLTTSNRFGSRQLGFIISYPRAKNGFVFDMLDRCGNLGGTTPEWWGDLAPTYRVLPWKTYEPVQVNGIERWRNATGFTNSEPDLEMARLFRDDPETFRAMYECEPLASEDAFIADAKRIDECVVPYLRPAAVWDGTITEDFDPSTDRTYRYVALALRDLAFRPGVTYFLGGDAGESQDSFAICLAHMVPANERGYISPDAWRDPKLRYSKHYRPEPLPVETDWDPQTWKCDHTGQVPVRGQHKFWGVCRPTGKPVRRGVIIGEEPDGTPIYAKDAKGVEVSREVSMPRVVQDLLLEWKPDRARGLTVDFRNVRDIILQIAKAARIGMCLFDKWQAVQMVQELRAAGIGAETKAFGAAAQLEWYRNYKTLLYNHLVDLLPGQEKARRQLRELQLVNGTRIDHPDYSAGGGMGGKDLTDAEALAFWLCCAPQYQPGTIDLGMGAPGSGMAQQSVLAERAALQEDNLVNQTLRGMGI